MRTQYLIFEEKLESHESASSFIKITFFSIEFYLTELTL